MRVIEFDRIDEWGPLLTAVVERIAPSGFLAGLRRSKPKYIEDARNHVVAAIGRQRLVEALNRELESCSLRVFHGTRVTGAEINQIRTEGLRALRLADRRASLIAVFSQHRDWSAVKEALLDEQLHRFGPGWQKAGAGRREDDSIHVCLSRAGLLLGCNHYLTHGAEVDQHIADALFPDGSGLDLLKCNRRAKLVSFTTPFAEAARAANPFGFPSHELPALLRLMIGAWAYKTAEPAFSVANQRYSEALRFPAPIEADRLIIEDIDDSELVEAEAAE
jgi:hypothetical protein